MSKKKLKACKNCHLLTEKDICPFCNTQTSKKWRGYIIIRNPSKSQIAAEMNVEKPGRYALKVR